MWYKYLDSIKTIPETLQMKKKMIISMSCKCTKKIGIHANLVSIYSQISFFESYLKEKKEKYWYCLWEFLILISWTIESGNIFIKEIIQVRKPEEYIDCNFRMEPKMIRI